MIETALLLVVMATLFVEGQRVETPQRLILVRSARSWQRRQFFLSKVGRPTSRYDLALKVCGFSHTSKYWCRSCTMSAVVFVVLKDGRDRRVFYRE